MITHCCPGRDEFDGCSCPDPDPHLDLDAPIRASADMDWYGIGYYTLESPFDCPSCDEALTWTRGTAHPDGMCTLTCPTCLIALGTLEEV